MERNFTNENFEGFLRQNAEGLRMRPSEKAWKGISKHLGRRRRRIGFMLSVSLLSVSALGYYVTDHAARQSSKIISSPAAQQTILTKNDPVIVSTADHKQSLVIGKNTRKQSTRNTSIGDFISLPVGSP